MEKNNALSTCPICRSDLIRTGDRVDCPQSLGCGWPGAISPLTSVADARERIVAQLSSTWSEGAGTMINVYFEECIRSNAKRGYGLESWQFNSVAATPPPVYYGDGNWQPQSPQIIETIIAVFVKLKDEV